MTLSEAEIGKCYSCHDDALYKLISKGRDWVCVLHYSYNHYACTAEIHNEEFLLDLEEETDKWMYDIFDEELRFDESWGDSLTNRD